jgi:hypothetical protein
VSIRRKRGKKGTIAAFFFFFFYLRWVMVQNNREREREREKKRRKERMEAIHRKICGLNFVPP